MEKRKQKKNVKKYNNNIATYLPDTYVQNYVINGECRMGKISFNL